MSTGIGIAGNGNGAGGSAPIGATLLKTNQTTSYRTGDDGDFQDGRSVDFFTLSGDNPFGNTDKVTDTLGTQVYANGILLDWSTFDGATVLGFRITSNGVNVDWNTAVDECKALNIGGFASGWKLPNRNQLFNLTNSGTSHALNYPPFSDGNNFRFWTSTSWMSASTYAVCLPNRPIEAIGATKVTSVNMRYYPCRIFTVTGTTLT